MVKASQIFKHSAFESFDSQGEQSMPETTIIQCPSCHTKFAIETTIILNAVEPKFHCSRCDEIFDAEIGTAIKIDPVKRSAAIEPEPVEEIFEEPQYLNDREQQATQAQASDSRKDQFSLGDTSTSWSLGNKKPYKGLEIPNPSGADFTSSAPYESISEEAEATDQMAFNFGTPTETKAHKHSSHTPDFPEDEPEWTSYARVAGEDTEFRLSEDHYKRLLGETEPPKILSEFEAVSKQRSSSVSGWRALLYFGSPLVACLLVLGALGTWAVQKPQLGLALQSTIDSNYRMVSPAELHIQKPKFRAVTLETGDTVYVISGQIANRSPNTFSEVILEGLAFDGSGKLVTSTRIDASSNFAKTRIKSLTPEMIVGIQSRPAARRSAVRPNEKLEFSFALTKDSMSEELATNLSQAKFFSVRVYSVRY